MNRVFAKAKIRYVAPTIFVGMTFPYFLALVLRIGGLGTRSATVKSAVLDIASYSMACALLWVFWCSNLRIEDVFGGIRNTGESRILLRLGIPMVGLAMFCYYLVYFPLSYIAPEFVLWWAVEGPEILVPLNRSDAFAINTLGVISAVLIAPVVEELMFRGFVLGRLSEKYGRKVSIVVSSVLFGVLHPDVLGGFIFSFMLCLIRIKYDSLYAPILVHVGNNAIVALLTAIELYIFGIEYQYTLAEFRSYWWMAPVGGVIGFPWLYRYYQQELAHISWERRPA